MQFTTGLLTLALAAAGVTAAPGVSERQAPGFTLFHLYSLPNCQGTLLTGQQFVDQGASSTGVCQAATQQSVTYASWLVRYNELTRPVSVFSAAGCSGSSVTVSPSTAINTCFNVQIGSGKF